MLFGKLCLVPVDGVRLALLSLPPICDASSSIPFARLDPSESVSVLFWVFGWNIPSRWMWVGVVMRTKLMAVLGCGGGEC